MATRKRGNMTPKAGVSKGTRSFDNGGKKSSVKRKYACGGKMKR